ncbi:GNAT family protein [Streptomyces sp. NPDC048057]|uniref:GNAT family N-acetyltransferase n=1 Tax=Streptomyces sp. NPDC048057 TaxID=3155628 RepID=UPI0033C84C57
MQGLLVRLLPVRREDFDLLASWAGFSSAGVLINGGQGTGGSAADWERRVESGTTRFALVQTSAGRKIGVVFWRRLGHSRNFSIGGFVGDEDIWDSGSGLEGAMLLTEYLFAFENAHRIELTAASYNKRSIAFLVKGGAVVEAVLRSSLFADGQYHDAVVCSLTREEYEAPFPGYQPSVRTITPEGRERAGRRARAHLAGRGGAFLRGWAQRTTSAPNSRSDHADT